jgi:hypothetical protein
MTLSHIIEDHKIASDGLAITLKDKTLGYGLDGNPARQDLSWVYYLTWNNGFQEVDATGVEYLSEAGLDANGNPVYAEANAKTANIVRVPLPNDGLYWLHSALLPLQGKLDDTLGDALVGSFCTDDNGVSVFRVSGATPKEGGGYTYSFESKSVKDAISGGSVTTAYPILQIHHLTATMDQALVTYMTRETGKDCEAKVYASLYNDNTEGDVGRDRYFSLCFELDGAEANLAAGLYENVLVNLRQASKIAAMIERV